MAGDGIRPDMTHFGLPQWLISGLFTETTLVYPQRDDQALFRPLKRNGAA
jgi:hypothetical protein